MTTRRGFLVGAVTSLIGLCAKPARSLFQYLEPQPRTPVMPILKVRQPGISTYVWYDQANLILHPAQLDAYYELTGFRFRPYQELTISEMKKRYLMAQGKDNVAPINTADSISPSFQKAGHATDQARKGGEVSVQSALSNNPVKSPITPDSLKG